MKARGPLPMAALIVLVLGCSDTLEPGERLAGHWGTRADGVPAAFAANADSALLRLPCSVARFPSAVIVDGSGGFTVIGQHSDWEGSVPAVLTGTTDGSDLDLTLTTPEFPSPLHVRVRRNVIPDFRDIVCLGG